MKKAFIPLLVVSSAFLATGCEQQPAGTNPAATPAAPVVSKDDAIAVVNGQFISKATLANLEKEIAIRSQGQDIPKEKLVEELVQRELLIQDAIQKQLDKSPEVLANIEDAKKSILTQADVQNFMKTNPVTDEEIKAEYDSKVAGNNAVEYKARHILVKTEEEAKKIIAELDKGGDFAKIANKQSLDAKESQSGGDLGWFVASQMVEPFSKAVVALEKGKYTTTPVQTQFGWHVILREDSRPQTPPPLESVKDQISPMLQRKKLQTMLESLRKQAKVEILIPLTDEKPKADKADAAKPADAAGQPAKEEVVVEEVKDANGNVVEEDVTVEETAATPAAPESKPEAAAEVKPEAAKPAEDKK